MKTKQPRIHLWIMMALMILVDGCVTARKCNEKFPSMTTTIIRDTTIFIPTTVTDTAFSFIAGDTVFIMDTITRVQIKFLKYPSGDTVFVSAICPPDTIRIPVEVTTTTGFEIPIPEKKTPWWWFFVAVLATAVGLGYFINALKK